MSTQDPNDPRPIPSHFFEKGEYEVWASKDGAWKSNGAHLSLITKDVTLQTARAFNWQHKEIRLHGKVVE